MKAVQQYKVILVSLLTVCNLVGLQVKLFAYSSVSTNPLIEYSESFYSSACGGYVLYKHNFKYNSENKIAFDYFTYYLSGELKSTTKFQYKYDASGRLSSRTSNHNQYKYYYNEAGALIKLECHFLVNNKWQLLEEVTLKHTTSAKGKVVHLVLNKKSSNSANSTIFNDIEYILNSKGNVTQAKVNRYGNKPINAIYSFKYDNSPNPLHDIFTERVFDKELEFHGTVNLISKSTKNKSQNIIYEYNAAGFPVRARIENYRLLEFRYQNDPELPKVDVMSAIAQINPVAVSEDQRSKQAKLRLTSVTDNFQHPIIKALAQYKHSFTYNEKGEPATHDVVYIANSKIISTTNFKYKYDNSGKLVAKNSQNMQLKFYYGASGQTEKVELNRLQNGEWTLSNVTELKIITAADKTKSIKLVRSYMKNGKLQLYNDSDYMLDSLGHMQKRHVHFYDKMPRNKINSFEYDSHPNPLRNLNLELHPDENIPHNATENLTNMLLNGNSYFNFNYEYNKEGYPVKRIATNFDLANKVENRSVREYFYETTGTEKPKGTDLEDENFVSQNSKNILVYPNPARKQFTLSADSLGNGPVEIRIYDIATTRLHRQTTFQVQNKLKQVIEVADLPRGFYIIELIAPKGIFSKRVVLE